MEGLDKLLKVLRLKSVETGGWEPIPLPTMRRRPVVYIWEVNGKMYIGQTSNEYVRFHQHFKNKPKSIFDKQLKMALQSTSKPVIKYGVLYAAKTNNSKDLKQIETKFIRELNTFLNGWNQQINNELPSQTIKKYILDYKLTKDPVLFETLEWKLDNCNLSHKITNKLKIDLYEFLIKKR